ncbi:hypothetical protein CcrC1_gp086 [Caulobacter phage C1]|nr:hypothetical protein CcrC1_gp086 [Caulobacter phage C1]UTU08314.1 hypothetical protein CcrC2_gp086 [Caulobacter phage C2]UTU08835.1 hypothetical protein CcrJ4_gp084 [Caulobacter phage J4]UTU09388.1 hypothetical protein CcrBL47_gp102 [Caulobacter phage BL47]UTU09948.1 hypothetical protein CcrRB23_gp086 [Caulobacter phage RB23]WGN96973.1 hypothetical protein [Bertelyvirus sp.]
MGRYRKTTVIDAVQYIAGETLPDGVHVSPDGVAFLITLQGSTIVYSGDWVCTGPGDQQWVVRKAVFAANYEQVPDEPAAGVPIDEVRDDLRYADPLAWAIANRPGLIIGRDPIPHG